MKEGKHYNEDFYDDQQEGSLRSAQEIIGIVNQVILPNSVVDVGCGVGYWLKVWKEIFGVNDILGIEGPYLKRQLLKIDAESVQFKDLKEPIKLERRFDLAMSLEVAEHLPKESADQFIDSLVRLSDVVLFSAAIVGQEGTFHINEQMPEYWAKKFLAHEYVPADFIRPRIWYNENIEWWYRQNVIFYVKKEKLDSFPLLFSAYKETNPEQLLRIQPWIYLYKEKYVQQTRTWIGYLRWKLYPVKKFFQGRKR